ncbi:transcriptional regulator, partial [Acinetobacter baumannii]|nr:transcriptional regulator [Acinetobacter baumannii]
SYIAALEGELSINVTLPTGKKVSFNL